MSQLPITIYIESLSGKLSDEIISKLVTGFHKLGQEIGLSTTDMHIRNQKRILEVNKAKFVKATLVVNDGEVVMIPDEIFINIRGCKYFNMRSIPLPELYPNLADPIRVVFNGRDSGYVGDLSYLRDLFRGYFDNNATLHKTQANDSDSYIEFVSNYLAEKIKEYEFPHGDFSFMSGHYAGDELVSFVHVKLKGSYTYANGYYDQEQVYTINRAVIRSLLSFNNRKLANGFYALCFNGHVYYNDMEAIQLLMQLAGDYK